MALTKENVVFTLHDGPAAEALLDELADAYADAYGVEPGGKVDAFRGRASKQFGRPGFLLVAARTGGQLVGFAFGYTLQPDTHWWVGLVPAPDKDFETETGDRTFVLSEIEVRRAWQGSGVGRRIHDELLGDRPEERATLATGPDAAAQSVYLSWGWQSVGRVPGTDGDYYSAYDLFVLPLLEEVEPR
jgi:GNAT superfamily N-acetyltransferase